MQENDRSLWAWLVGVYGVVGPCYLEAVGSRQAPLLPEPQGTLQLLCRAQGEGVRLA